MIQVQHQEPRELFSKIRSLPPEKIAVVEDFVEFLRSRDDVLLARTAAKVAEPSFQRVWDNPEDAVYDNL